MGGSDSAKEVFSEGQVTAGKVMVCSRCSHRWIVRKRDGLPKNCPKCRSTVWMKDYHICRCYRCNHEWGTVNKEPKRCPKCHSVKWAVPVRRSDAALRSRLAPRNPIDREEVEDVLRRYADGESCTSIAISTGMSFSDVYDIVRSNSPDGRILV